MRHTASSNLSLFLFFSALICLSTFCSAYLPGLAPKGYQKGDEVVLKVNSLTSVHTQLPYKYYSLPWCQPAKITNVIENLGEILMGDKIENSLFKIKAGVDQACVAYCHQTFNADDLHKFGSRIREEYQVNWIVDGLPVATRRAGFDTSNPNLGSLQSVYTTGFPLGRREGDDNYLNNHVDITFVYYKGESAEDGEELIYIVGFEANPSSINYSKTKDVEGKDEEKLKVCPPKEDGLKAISGLKDDYIAFTYSVTWKPDQSTSWGSRFDLYLPTEDEQIHWFSIINSLMIVLFLTGMVAMIMLRTLHKDMQKYNTAESAEEAQEETGWKLVHGDVFRTPSQPMLLSVLVGTGAQVGAMAFITMFFAVLGFLSPANRGSLLTALVVLFVVMGVVAGYFSARLYKLFKGQHWKQNTIMTATLFPGTVFTIFLVLNFVLKFEGSSGAVPFGALVALIALWFGISVPLVFLGSYFGFKKPAEEIKIRTNQIPRQIPDQVWYMRPIFSILMGGVLPFGAVFIELFFILSSIWLQQFYYIFGFLSIVFIILILTCAEIAIVMCYFQLCSEDYHWWWRSYLTSGASAFYMFLYSVFYFFTKLEITKPASIFLYFGYSIIMALGFFVLTGSIGFYACFFFVKKIYGSIKLD